MRTVLVTGGAGYIGSHTCKLLSTGGCTPVVLDNLAYGHASFVRWGPFVQGDISDPAILDSVFKTYEPEAVIHFAAYAYVGESMIDPAKYYRNNVSGTINLLEAMRRNNCNQLVFSSSCATYGLPERVPIDEGHRQAPINPYGMSKLMVEQILGDYDQAYGLKSLSLRYFNAAGADSDGDIGEDHTPETHLIPLVFYSLFGQTDKLEIYGTDYETPDGTAVRDYIHVSDLAQAHVRGLDFLRVEKKSICLNLGTGQGLSVKQIVKEVEKVTAQAVPVVYGARRPGDPPILVADPRRAGEVLGWRARNSSASAIISSAGNWHRKRHQTERPA
jgi:UDP-glucose-4-epimerase GalE